MNEFINLRLRLQFQNILFRDRLNNHTLDYRNHQQDVFSYHKYKDELSDPKMF